MKNPAGIPKLSSILVMVALGCAGFAAGFGWVYLQSAKTRDAPDSLTPTPAPAIDSAPSTPSGEPTVPATTDPAPAPPPSAPAGTVPEETTDEPLTEEQSNAQTTAFYRNSMQLREDDPAWSTEASAAIARHLQETPAEGYSVSNVRCRADLCSLDIHETDPGSSDRLLTQLPTLDAFHDSQAAIIPARADDGLPAMTVFITRSGRSLPTGE
jgi:type IV secretory pathway VirB10-like protein